MLRYSIDVFKSMERKIKTYGAWTWNKNKTEQYCDEVSEQ